VQCTPKAREMGTCVAAIGQLCRTTPTMLLATLTARHAWPVWSFLGVTSLDVTAAPGRASAMLLCWKGCSELTTWPLPFAGLCRRISCTPTQGVSQAGAARHWPRHAGLEMLVAAFVTEPTRTFHAGTADQPLGLKLQQPFPDHWQGIVAMTACCLGPSPHVADVPCTLACVFNLQHPTARGFDSHPHPSRQGTFDCLSGLC
jgi:hypothetical protein